MSEPPFRRLGIIGLGLIGGSVALAARAAWPAVTVVGCDREAELAEAVRRGIVDRAAHAIAELAEVDAIVLATPVAVMVDRLPEIAALSSPAVVTDVGSTKRGVMAAAVRAGVSRFVGGHPMAGGERGGVEQARADLFHGRPWMLVAGASAADACGRDVETFVRALGAIPQWIDAETHDRVVAYISHVPQLLAVALMNATVDALGDRGLLAAGRAFTEMTRLASSPPDLWQGILSGNIDNVVVALEDVMAHLPHGGDLEQGRWIAEAFSRAHAGRMRLLHGDPDRE